MQAQKKEPKWNCEMAVEINPASCVQHVVFLPASKVQLFAFFHQMLTEMLQPSPLGTPLELKHVTQKGNRTALIYRLTMH